MIKKLVLFALVTIAAIAISEKPTFAQGKEGYHFAEVRAHQFVEVWPSLNPDGKAIHIKVKVSNGVQMAPFSPTVWIDLVGPGGSIVARYIQTYKFGPAGFHGGVDRTYDYNIARPELWSMTEKVVIHAFEKPPGTGPANMPTVGIFKLDDPLKCLGNC